MPLWDVAFFYEKGTLWEKHPPKPKTWVKQVAFYGESASGITGRFWKNDFASPLFDTDWFVALRQGMSRMLGESPVGESKVGSSERTGIDQEIQLTSLAESLEALRKRFNENKDKPRLVAIMSPT